MTLKALLTSATALLAVGLMATARRRTNARTGQNAEHRRHHG
jgi:hypothetical protein